MNTRILCMLFPVLFIFTACNTTVITDEDRELPDPEHEAIEETSEESHDDDGFNYTANTSKSYIAFTGAKGGGTVSHEGKFSSYDFSFAGEEVEDATLTVSIDITSMQTDSSGLTSHLQAEDFFDAASHPTATFTALEIEEGKEDNTYSVTGDLTMKGVTASVTFDAVITQTYLTATIDVDRTVFGVGGPVEGLKGIDANVPVEVKIVFK